ATNEMREFHRIAHEKDRRIVSDEIVISLVGVKLHRKAAHIAPGIGAALFAGNRRETNEHIRTRAGLEQRRLRVGRYVLGDFQDAERSGTLGVRAALGTRSRLKCAICSTKCTSCSRIGPLLPTERLLRSLAAGAPEPAVAPVERSGLVGIIVASLCSIIRVRLTGQLQVPAAIPHSWDTHPRT